MALWMDLLGTTKSFLRIGLSGVRLKNVGGDLAVRNAGDTADAAITAGQLNASGDVLVLNSDAASAADDWLYALQRPATGMTGAVTLTLPASDGSPNQVLRTDGDGNLDWADAADTSANLKIDTTPLDFDSTTTVPMLTIPEGAVITRISTVIDAPFDGTPSASIGVSGDASKYVGSDGLDLTLPAGTVIHSHPGLGAAGVGGEALEIAYAAGGATQGAARMRVEYAIPS